MLQVERPDARISIKAGIAVQLDVLQADCQNVGKDAAQFKAFCVWAGAPLSRRGKHQSPPTLSRVQVRLGIPVLLLMQLARQAGAQVEDPVPHATLDPRSITLPIVDGADIRFRRLSMSEGLLQTKVAQIVQDDEGFMWFGTQHGLNRYDGYSLQLFVNDPKNPSSLSGVPVGALFKDRDGALWVGCDQFLNRFDRRTETFARFPILQVRHISQDARGVLWLATPSGLYEFDRATAQTRRYSHIPNDPWSLRTNNVQSSGEDRKGNLWVATTEGLEQFDRNTGRCSGEFRCPNLRRRFTSTRIVPACFGSLTSLARTS